MRNYFAIKAKAKKISIVILCLAIVLSAISIQLSYRKDSYAVDTGGFGGVLSDQNDVSFTSAGYTSTYHLYSSTIDTSKPIGLMLHFHGDGAWDYDNYNSDSALDADGAKGLVQVARDYNMIFVSVKTPVSGSICDSAAPCWWDNGNTNSDYVAALMQDLYGKYNIDKTKIWYVGFSGGSQLITQYLVVRHSDLVEGGGAVIFGGGGSPVRPAAWPKPIFNINNISQRFKNNFKMFWFTGKKDNGQGSADGYNALADAQDGVQWFSDNGFITGYNFSYDINHNDLVVSSAGYLGLITRQQLSASYDFDSTPPRVSLTDLAPNSEVKDNISLSAAATDNVAIAKVEFFYGSVKIGESTSSPYTVSWDTTSVADGSYEISAKATDVSGNSTVSSTVTIIIKNTKPAESEDPEGSSIAPNSNDAVVSVPNTGLIWLDSSLTI